MSFEVRRVVLERLGSARIVAVVRSENDVALLLQRIRAELDEISSGTRCAALTIVVHAPSQDCDHEMP